MDTDLIDDAACATSDLTARLRAELCLARAQLAVADARAVTALSAGGDVPADVRSERLLHRQRLRVLHRLLAGIPTIDDGEDRAISA